MTNNKKSQFTNGLWGAVFIVILWEAIPLIFSIKPSILPPFHSVIQSMYVNRLRLYQELSITALESFVSWIVAVLIAGGMACSMEMWPLFEKLALYPLRAVQNIPKVAITPLIIVWLGHGITPIIALGVLVAFFPIFEGYREGLLTDKTGIREVFGPLCRNKYIRLARITHPEGMEKILHGCRVGMTLATVGVIVGELATPDHGLGRLISDGTEIFKYDLQFAAVLAVSILGLLLYGLVVLIESKFLSHYKYTVSSIIKDR